MGLKDLLQNPDESKRAAKRVLKASAAFTSLLLLGNKETGSKGLVRTVGGAAAAGTTGFLASMAAQSSSASVEEEEDDLYLHDDFYADGWRPGWDGYGHYIGDIRVDDGDGSFPH